MEGINRNRWASFFVLVFALIALAYGNTLHSPFNFDDSMVIKTEIAQSGEQYFNPTPPRYRHLFYLSIAINYSQGKLNPLGYHLFNISLHFLTTFAIFFVSFITIKRGTEWGRHALSIAVVTTLFFALSPVHSETVTYISGRTSGLAGFFYFFTLLLFILGSFRERALVSRVICYLLSVCFFAASVLSKEISLTLPAIVLLYDFCFMNGDRWSPRKTRFLYFYLPLIICAVFAALFMKSMIVDWWHKIDFAYALQQARIVAHGFHLLLFPIGLTLDYDFPDAFFPHPALRAWPILLIVLLIAGIAKYFPKALKLSTFCALWFLVTIAPTNSFLPRLDLLSERNLYIPSFGIFFFITSFAVPLFTSQGLKLRKVGLCCLLTLLALHTVLLIERNAVYQSNIAIWKDTVKKAPGKTRAWHNLSHYYLMELNFEKAYDSIQGLLRSNPSVHYQSFAQSKLGVIHSRKGNLPQAIASYQEGIRLNPTGPINHLNLGGLYLRQGNFSQARDTYDKAEQLFKKNPSFLSIPKHLYRNKAFALFYMGLYEQAETNINTYLKMDPGSNSARSLLENIYTATKIKRQKPPASLPGSLQ